MTVAGFRTIPAGELRAVIVGAGEMGATWVETVSDSADVTLAGVVDRDARAVEAAAQRLGRSVAAGSRLADVVAESGANVVIDVTPPEAHLEVTIESLALGLPVLGEKPAAATLAQALILAAAAERSGELFMVSQSRRYNGRLAAYRARIRALGPVGVLTTQFFRGPRFGGYRETMAHPLLVDMAIHPFDTARWLLGSEPVAVLCEEYNPPWSWYAGDACLSAVFEMDSGARYSYTGSWCSPALETSWNGEWRASTAAGSAIWDGENECTVEPAGVAATAGPVDPAAEGTAGALADFVAALRTGGRPMGEVHDNVMSLAMVAAAQDSSVGSARVMVDSVLERALAEALADAPGELAEVLRGWSSVRESLATQ